MKWLLIGFVKLWRKLLSPMYGDVCKYYPSCSAYGLEALQLHGAVKGSALAIWRVLRCNPWSKGGFDPVPGSPLQRRAAEWWGAEDGPDDGRPDGADQERTTRVAQLGTSAAPAVMG